MIDRTKVIKGLKYCKEYFSCCDKCPYWHSGTQCVSDLANDAYTLLKEQEAEIKRLEKELAVTQDNLNYYVKGRCYLR